ncbi:MAG: hypothetical protein AB1775_02930 [Bacteroidota bacterium]
MKTLPSQEKNKEAVKEYSWALIIMSIIFLPGGVFISRDYSQIINMRSLTRNSNPPIEINFTLYFLPKAVELLLCIVVFVSATFVLKFSERWRNILVYSLIVSIIYLAVLPIVTYYNFDRILHGLDLTSELIGNYAEAVVLSAFFIVIIIKLSKEEIRLLFK